MNALRNGLFWAITILTLLFNGLFCLSSFSEWWIVAIKKETGAYPWGPINDNPWYYDTPEIYSNVMFSEFVITAIGLGIMIYFIIKGEKRKILFASLGVWILVLIMAINGQIQE